MVVFFFRIYPWRYKMESRLFFREEEYSKCWNEFWVLKTRPLPFFTYPDFSLLLVFAPLPIFLILGSRSPLGFCPPAPLKGGVFCDFT